MPLHALRVSRRIEFRTLRSFLPRLSDESICDIGCGDGYWTTRLARHNFVAGVELDLSPLRDAQRQHGDRVRAVNASATHLPFRDGCFTQISGICSIEHIMEDQEAFAECARCLSPGGYLAISVDSLTHPAITDEQRKHHCRKYAVAHLYDYAALEAALAGAGFRIVRHRFIGVSRLSHWLLSVFDRVPRLQYLLFPVAYPAVLLTDRFAGSRNYGWKLAALAVKTAHSRSQPDRTDVVHEANES